MISLRGLRSKIKSVKSIQQIARAMKMVSSIRLKYAREKIILARPFAQKMQELLEDLNTRLKEKQCIENISALFPLMETKKTNRIGLIMITSDRGLCGGFNSNILRVTMDFIQKHKDTEIETIVIGKRGRNALLQQRVPLTKEYVNIFAALRYTHAELIGKELIDLYLTRNLSEVYVIYAQLKSIIQQPVVVERLLPVSADTVPIPAKRVDYLYEPPCEQLLETLIPRYVKSQIYRILLESAASEHAARMVATEAAMKNSKKVIDLLALQTNKMRQEKITEEISELSAVQA